MGLTLENQPCGWLEDPRGLVSRVNGFARYPAHLSKNDPGEATWVPPWPRRHPARVNERGGHSTQVVHSRANLGGWVARASDCGVRGL